MAVAYNHGCLTMRRSEEGRQGAITLRMESGDEAVLSKEWGAAMYIGAGSDPYELINQGVAAAAELSGGALPGCTCLLKHGAASAA